jgi:hypothetical protein
MIGAASITPLGTGESVGDAVADCVAIVRLSCRHDGLGTVECNVTVRQPEPPEWSMRAVLDFGAGAHIDRVAAAVETFFEGAYLPLACSGSVPLACRPCAAWIGG